jgi:hypothetical protein
MSWWVLVDPRTPEERDASQEKGPGAVLASWEVSLFGMRFLDDLVKEGRARQHSFNGYPNRYTVPAGDFVPFIVNGPPVVDWGPNKGWTSRVTIHRDELLALPADHMLTVDVWDQS